MLEISAIVKKTEELFDLFNARFYDRARPPGYHGIAGRRA